MPFPNPRGASAPSLRHAIRAGFSGLGRRLACWLILAQAALAADRPNLLWITSEDNSPYLGCYGDAQAQTPHLDRLAAQGVRYRNAFANAPVCSSTRTTLITGMHASSLGVLNHRSRVQIPSRFKLYPEHLRAAGYYATNNLKTDYNLAGNPQPWDESSARAHYRNRKAGQPFFAVFNLTTSHESQVKPKEGKTSFRIPPEKIQLPPYHPDTPELRRDWANYYDQMTLMDRQVGEFLAELEREGLAGDTIVFYCSDHGGALPRGKRNIHDSGTRVPLIVRFPEKWRHLAPAPAGGWAEQPVSFVDLPVTFFSLLGVPIPGHYEGRGFLGEKKAAPREHVFLYRARMDERYDTVRAIRDREFRYVRNYSPHRPWGQHYSYPFDVMPGMGSWFEAFKQGRTNAEQSRYWQPNELRNLAGGNLHAARREALRKALRAEIIATRDTGFIPEGMFERLAGTGTIYDYAQSPAYPIERIVDLAERAAAGEPRWISDLQKGAEDRHPVVRYWSAVGGLVLKERAAPLKSTLLALLRDEIADVRVVAAEALGYLGEKEPALAALTEVVQTGRPYEVLAALNALEYMWRAGHAPLDRVQAIVRDLKLSEPADRIPRFLLSQK
jgi:N-sulfoglucosamine sulfohydrolase